MADRKSHVVGPGDTLWSIAKANSTTVSKLVEINNIEDPNVIIVGEVIYLEGDVIVPEPTVAGVAVVTSLGLQAGTDRTLVARWDWTQADTDHYEVRWWWGPEGQLGVIGEESTTTHQHAVYTAPSNAERVSFYVRPISKTFNNGKTDVHCWVSNWTTKETYYFKDNPPTSVSAPSVSIEYDELIINLDNIGDANATHVEFQIVKGDGTDWITDPIPITYSSVHYICYVDSGSDYKVRCRTIRDGITSDWSPYSSKVGTAPSASGGITKCRAATSTSVYLSWARVPNADSYDIEYATKLEYFDGSDNTTIKSGIESTSYTLTGLESGTEYFFRVRAVNENGESSWSGFQSIILGKKPAAPTTWSSTTTAITGEPLILYWVHNSEDGSTQTKGQLELTINGKVTTLTIPKFVEEEEEEETSSYSFDTSSYVAGTKLEWRVRTCGITGEYGDWSMQRSIDIYARPTLKLRLTNADAVSISTVTGFPFMIDTIVGPNTQTPVSYHLSIVSNESYETVDHLGNEKFIIAGSEIYSVYADISTNLTVMLMPDNVDLENNISYTIKCVVSMDSGLTAEAKKSFTVAWTDNMCVPNAEIGIDRNSYAAVIRPYCEDGNNELVSDVLLSVYRREFNGGFTEIAKKLPNTRSTYVTDPHPALDYARYRIVATSNTTGAVSYFDVAGYPVGVISAIIQWDETWTDFDVIDDVTPNKQHWSGSMLKIPYNIDVSNKHSVDTALVEYIGRKHPVSYYGTQLGESATWSMAIPKSDKNTLYALRRLAAWTGDVYVREPSGSGYWASVNVSFSQKHCDLVIPITLEVTRVEGGM